MLSLVNIKKDYKVKDQESVHALKGISLNFRKSEFVAILGHSGCGKTTMLNIIGGLDKYSSGDLIIEGRSTKFYKDSDWDTYRNHSIGFVFQSYNLIPHQSILGNVELALTIAGVSKQERRKRSIEALTRVGLKDCIKKKPNQLSGGQMQRVAIARALVNNPEILLADEPTGALDSETSIQIMDLLKEVAKDRLVIMVTHNPDLAYKYANRIVKMSDGLITDDSNPYDEVMTITNEEKVVKQKGKKQSSMSFFTAFNLSLSNLVAKLKRTLLVVIAGSIGIIGVASVLSVSTGVNSYIDNMQNDMLSSYPVEISEQSVDYTSLMTGLDTWNDKDLYKFDTTTEVGIDSMINYLMSAYEGFTSIKTNTIDDNLLKYLEGLSKDDVANMQYNYGIDVTNNIFTTIHDPKTNTDSVISLNGLTQKYISELKTVDDFKNYASYVNLFTNFMNELPDSEDYILSQYDLIGNSRFATNEDEIMLVVDSNTTLTDLVLAQLGYFEHDEFLNLAKKAIESNKEDSDKTVEELNELYPYTKSFTFDSLLDKDFYYLPHNDIYSYGNIVSESYDEISVVLKYSDNDLIVLTYDANSDTLQGIYLTTSPFNYGIVYLQRLEGEEKPTNVDNLTDLVYGSWVGINGDMNHYLMCNINKAMNKAIVYKTDDIKSFDPSKAMPLMFESDIKAQNKNNLITGYKYDAVLTDEKLNCDNLMKMKVVGILRAKESTNFGSLQRGVYYTKKFATKYINDANNSDIITNEVTGLKAYIGSNKEKEGSFNAYVTYKYLSYNTDKVNGILTDGYASSLNGDLSRSFADLFSSLTGVDYFEQDCVYLRSLAGLKVTNEENKYTYSLVPSSIKIYPYDFECKNHITTYLDKWNEEGAITCGDITLNKDNREELTYTDSIQLIVSVIDTLIETITIALVSFTSLSLVVSCFMIAVITYISVMERVKEIGVIRSLGGRKKDVSRLFIAENFINGLASGIFGIIITGLLCIILNSVISKYNVGNIGMLTSKIALIMTLLSVGLSVLSGFIPSLKASKQDPVTALRSE